MIEFIQVSKTYTAGKRVVKALQGVSLSVAPQEIFGVIGRSGAGKSSLIRCANLLEVPDKGQVLINGQDLLKLSTKDLRAIRHKIGMIFQHFNLLNARTVYQNIALPLELMHMSKKAITEKVEPLLTLTGLEAKRDSHPHQLSGGEKQRVAIARALASEPLILLCDEATSALDPHTTQEILQLLKNINQKLGVTILLITHEMEVVKKICDKVALLDRGKIIEVGTIAEFFGRPKSALAKTLVHSLLKQELPADILTNLKEKNGPNLNPLWQIFFQGHAAEDPLITELVRQFNLEVNILQAKIETLQKEVFGIMVVLIKGPAESLVNARNFLQTRGAAVEVLGYVAN